MKNELIIYWSPSTFILDDESWTMLYKAPKNIFESIVESAVPKASLLACPAAKDLYKNIFSFDAVIDEKFEIPKDYLSYVDTNLDVDDNLDLESKISFSKTRDSQLMDHTSIKYNMSFSIFASEPVYARFTAPFFPASSIAPGAKLIGGRFDIGQWLRDFHLEYIVPQDTKEICISSGDPLFFLELETDKKIIFKRFVMNRRIKQIMFESAFSTFRYASRLPLKKRYEMFKQSKMREIVLREIEKELVE